MRQEVFTGKFQKIIKFDKPVLHVHRRMAFCLQLCKIQIEVDNKFHTYQRMTSGQLSGGEVRIAEMYMVLNSEAEFCILDEPFSNVAPKYVEMMQQLIQQHKATKGIIISDHMYEQVMDITDDLFLLRDGYTFPIKCREDLIHHGYILR